MTAPETALRLPAPIHQNSRSYRSKHTGSGLRDLPATTRSVLRLQDLLVHVLLNHTEGIIGRGRSRRLGKETLLTSLPRCETTVTSPGLTSDTVPEGCDPPQFQETMGVCEISSPDARLGYGRAGAGRLFCTPGSSALVPLGPWKSKPQKST